MNKIRLFIKSGKDYSVETTIKSNTQELEDFLSLDDVKVIKLNTCISNFNSKGEFTHTITLIYKDKYYESEQS